MKNTRLLIAINPYYCLFLLYFIANLLAFLTISLGIPIFVDSKEMAFSVTLITIGSVVLFSTLFASLICYRLALFSVSNPRERLSFGPHSSFFLALLQLFFLIFNTYYGINIAGIEESDVDKTWLRFLFAAMQPDLFFLLMSVGIQNSRFFWLNSIIFGVSLAMRGWIGGFFLLAMVWLIRNYPVHLQRKNIKFLVLILLICLVILPIIISTKWFIRAGGGAEDAWNFLQDYGYVNYLIDSLLYLANRFQHLGHAVFLLENSESLNRAYQSGAYVPYFMDAAPQWLFMRLNGETIISFNKFIVNFYFDSNNFAYATNPGVSGWLFAVQEESLFFICFLFCITFVPLILILKFIGFKYFLLINCLILVYLFHGWIGAYVNSVLYLLPIYFLGKIKSFFSVSLYKNAGKKYAPNNGSIVPSDISNAPDSKNPSI